jgi:FkbM family methyltransferase
MKWYQKILWPVLRFVRPYFYFLLYPQVVSLTGITKRPMKFELLTDTERYRTINYGDERDVLTNFLTHISDDDCVFDIGASIGLFTVATAQVADRGTVYSFEPDPAIRTRLIRNVSLNELHNVHVIDWAVGNSEGVTTLFTSGVDGASPSLRKLNNLRQASSIDIKVNSIDRAIEKGLLPVPTVLKIDIEGAETMALSGMQRTLSGEFGQPPRVMLIEIHPHSLPEFGSTAAEADHILSELENYQLQYRFPRSNEDIRIYKRID